LPIEYSDDAKPDKNRSRASSANRNIRPSFITVTNTFKLILGVVGLLLLFGIAKWVAAPRTHRLELVVTGPAGTECRSIYTIDGVEQRVAERFPVRRQFDVKGGFSFECRANEAFTGVFGASLEANGRMYSFGTSAGVKGIYGNAQINLFGTMVGGAHGDLN
jgi:hypothetical protein